MAFKTRKIESSNFTTPQEMFQDNKLKTIMGLIDYQSQMLDNYMVTINDEKIIKKNVAFELPTGSGKTLVGLLIAEFHRRKYQRKVLFLCPTNQLVVQVCEQAKKQYGLNAIAFRGKQIEYAPGDKAAYNLAKSIGVTTYSSFFALGSCFEDPDIIIFDDVHSSENYIIENWSLNIERKKFPILFNQIVESLRDIIGESGYARISADDPFSRDVMDWSDMLPRPSLISRITELFNIINANVEDTNLRFAWRRIADNLINCNIFVSWSTILIRPYIAPTQTHFAFNHASQKIFMSATLGNSGELERIVGIPNITRLPIVSGWDTKGLGRRLFIFPDLSLSAELHNPIIVRLHNQTKRSVLIVPSDNDLQFTREFIEKQVPEITLLNANDLIESKDNFITADNAMVIMANRFDGVDFPDEESRMLIIYNLPKVTHLQEKFFVSKMAASILFSERIKTRIVQAVGRCTRNASDYSVVCVLGDSVLNEFTSKKSLATYHPEMRAEIEFGIENSTDFKSVDDIIENVHIFYERTDAWKSAEEEIVQRRDEYIAVGKDTAQEKLYEKLCASAQLEVKTQYELWQKDYQSAFETTESIIATLDAPALSGYKCFWQYLCGSLAIELDQSKKAFEMFLNAVKNNSGSNKWLANLLHGISSSDDAMSFDDYFFDTVSGIENELEKIHKDAKFEQKVKTILEQMRNGKGTQFEDAHLALGTILGYDAHNSDEPSAPDPYWIINDYLCIVAEDKIYDSPNKEIPTVDVSQAMRHKIWIQSNVDNLNENAKILTVFFTNSSSITEDARTFGKDIFYCNQEDLVKWANKALGCLRSARSIFSETGDSEWRATAHEVFSNNQVTPLDFINMITQKTLFSL